MITQTGRQTELSRAKLLFSIAGSSALHFDEAIANEDISAALCFLLLVQDEALAIADSVRASAG